MRLNKNKIIVMECSKTNPIQLNISIDNVHIRQVQQFTYSGSNITEDGRRKTDIICMIAQAKKSLLRRFELHTDYYNSDGMVALFSCETWKINSMEKNRLVAFEKRSRKML